MKGKSSQAEREISRYGVLFNYCKKSKFEMFRFVLIIAPQQVKVPDLARTCPAQFKQIF